MPSRLYKTVYPNGLENYATPAASTASSRAASIRSETSGSSSPKPAKSGFFSRFTGATLTVPSTPHVPIIAEEGSVDELILSGAAFGKLAVWLGYHARSYRSLQDTGRFIIVIPGLYLLLTLRSRQSFQPRVLLAPSKDQVRDALQWECSRRIGTHYWLLRGVVGFFGFNHDRKLALQALAVSAAKTDVHSVFAGYAAHFRYPANRSRI